MAIMIPTDGYFEPKSGEKDMFDALKKLPDDYYVFHSYRLVQLIFKHFEKSVNKK